METGSPGEINGSLVSTDWLASNLDRNDLVVVDIRGYVRTNQQEDGRQIAEYVGAPDEYRDGHIPGAVFVDWTRDIVDASADVAAQIAPPDAFRNAMESRGIGDNTFVIAVDHSGGHFATRLWWALRYFGHDEVGVLDGGFKKWEREHRPITTEVPVPLPASFTPRERFQMRVTAAEVLEAVNGNGRRIIDARDGETFRGEVYRGARAGHIPGAQNISAKLLFNDDGTWKSDDILRETLSAIPEDEHVIAYCNGGVTATAVLFALDRIGHEHWANYDGSWNEWGGRKDLPVETGS